MFFRSVTASDDVNEVISFLYKKFNEADMANGLLNQKWTPGSSNYNMLKWTLEHRQYRDNVLEYKNITSRKLIVMYYEAKLNENIGVILNDQNNPLLQEIANGELRCIMNECYMQIAMLVSRKMDGHSKEKRGNFFRKEDLPIVFSETESNKMGMKKLFNDPGHALLIGEYIIDHSTIIKKNENGEYSFEFDDLRPTLHADRHVYTMPNLDSLPDESDDEQDEQMNIQYSSMQRR